MQIITNDTHIEATDSSKLEPFSDEPSRAATEAFSGIIGPDPDRSVQERSMRAPALKSPVDRAEGSLAPWIQVGTISYKCGICSSSSPAHLTPENYRSHLFCHYYEYHTWMEEACPLCASNFNPNDHTASDPITHWEVSQDCLLTCYDAQDPHLLPDIRLGTWTRDLFPTIKNTVGRPMPNDISLQTLEGEFIAYLKCDYRKSRFPQFAKREITWFVAKIGGEVSPSISSSAQNALCQVKLSTKRFDPYWMSKSEQTLLLAFLMDLFQDRVYMMKGINHRHIVIAWIGTNSSRTPEDVPIQYMTIEPAHDHPFRDKLVVYFKEDHWFTLSKPVFELVQRRLL